VAALLTIELVVLALFAWFCVVKVVPDCNVSILRYRLWRVRDRLADQIRLSVYENEDAARGVLQVIEGCIAGSHELGIIKVVVARWAVRDDDSFRANPLDRPDLSDSDRHRLRGIIAEVESLGARHIAFGSPSGWVITCLLVPAAIIVSVYEKFRRPKDHGSVLGHARQRVRRETTPPIYQPEDTGTHRLTQAY
jgi:hypothetical protein